MRQLGSHAPASASWRTPVMIRSNICSSSGATQDRNSSSCTSTPARLVAVIGHSLAWVRLGRVFGHPVGPFSRSSLLTPRQSRNPPSIGRSPSPAGRKRNRWNCAPRPIWRGYGASKAGGPRRMNCSRRSTAGSPKGSTPPTSRTPRRCSTRSCDGHGEVRHRRN